MNCDGKDDSYGLYRRDLCFCCEVACDLLCINTIDPFILFNLMIRNMFQILLKIVNVLLSFENKKRFENVSNSTDCLIINLTTLSKNIACIGYTLFAKITQRLDVQQKFQLLS